MTQRNVYQRVTTTLLKLLYIYNQMKNIFIERFHIQYKG